MNANKEHVRIFETTHWLPSYTLYATLANGIASGGLYNTTQSHVLHTFLSFRQGGWEPEPSAPDTDPESDCQCQLLVSSASPLGLQLCRAQCAQSILASLWHYFFTRI